jgi:hypothetical protein
VIKSSIGFAMGWALPLEKGTSSNMQYVTKSPEPEILSGREMGGCPALQDFFNMRLWKPVM